MDHKQELLKWLNEQLRKAEYALSSREQMAESCERTADPEYWRQLASQPGVTMTMSKGGKSKGPTEEEMKQRAISHRKIAEKDRNDVANFKAVIAALNKE